MKILCILLIIFSSQKTKAWGQKAQRLTVFLSEKHLTDEARRQTKLLLNGQSLSSLASWADEVKKNPQWIKTGPWHYYDLATSAEEVHQVKDAPKDAVDAIEYCIANLKLNLPNEEKIISLKFLIHLIGDIHQPLHTGNPDDKGGLKTKVKFKNKQISLHRFWDTEILDQSNLSTDKYADEIIAFEFSKDALVDSFNTAKIVEENISLRPFIYSFKKSSLDEKYIANAEAIANERVWISAMRLANVLNQVFVKK